MRQLLCGAGGLALTILLISGGPASAADPSARLGKLNCEAGDVAEFDGQRWVCAPKGGGTELVLLDANGNVIGPVLNYRNPNQLVGVVDTASVDVLVTYEIPSTADLVPVLLTFHRDSIRTLGYVLFYESADCSGQPYVVQSRGGELFFGPFAQAVVEYPTQDSTTPQNGPLLWVVPDTERQVITTHSGKGTGARPIDSSCGPTVSTGPKLPLELVDPNLYETFPPPYTLELQDGR